MPVRFDEEIMPSPSKLTHISLRASGKFFISGGPKHDKRIHSLIKKPWILAVSIYSPAN